MCGEVSQKLLLRGERARRLAGFFGSAVNAVFFCSIVPVKCYFSPNECKIVAFELDWVLCPKDSQQKRYKICKE